MATPEAITPDAISLVAHALDDRWVDDDVWYELATGALSPEQVAAMQRHTESPEDIERKLKLFGPTSKESRDRTLDLLLQRYYPPSGSSESGSGESGPADAGSTVPLQLGSHRRSRRWWSSAAFPGVALAAAVLLVWVVQRPEPPEALPRFELDPVEGPLGPLRSTGYAADPQVDDCAETTHAYPRDRSLSLALRPDVAVEDALSMAVFAESKGGWTGWLEPKSPDQTLEGVLTIDQPVTELGLTPGAWTLTFYVVRAGQVYRKDELRSLDPSEHPEVAIVSWSICIVE